MDPETAATMAPERSTADPEPGVEVVEPAAPTFLPPPPPPPMPMPMAMPPPPLMSMQPPSFGPPYPGFQPHLGGYPAYPMQMSPGAGFGSPMYHPCTPPPPPPLEPGVRRPMRRPVGGRVRFAPRVDSDADSVTEADDESVASSYLDPNGWETFAVADAGVKIVYEAWEVTALDDTQVSSTWKRFLGINFGVRWRAIPDGFIRLAPLMAFEQGELEQKVDDTVQSYNAKNTKAGGKSYDQDLANRAYKLPEDIYNQIQRLLDDKTMETNMNCHSQRAWNMVLLKEEELAITEKVPERKKRKGLFGWFKRNERPAVDRWFIIIKGEETKYSKAGWTRHDRFSNPWRKIDRNDALSRRHSQKM